SVRSRKNPFDPGTPVYIIAIGMLMLPVGLLSLCHTIELSRLHYKEQMEAETRRQIRIEKQFKSITDRLVE
ncbi:MAG TPA: hypothetical protein VG711_05160, partial [Phycisphaerales bacterium]|nr:hypothetical protein [Phycisphaerales bacterium]